MIAALIIALVAVGALCAVGLSFDLRRWAERQLFKRCARKWLASLSTSGALTQGNPRIQDGEHG